MFFVWGLLKRINGNDWTSFILGKRKIIDYLTHSYYFNLFMQYDYFEKTVEIHFTLNQFMQLFKQLKNILKKRRKKMGKT